MAYDKHAKLVERLHEKTDLDQLDWKATSDEDTFQLALRTNGIRLTRFPSDGNGNPTYVVELVNDKGEIVESVTDGQIDKEKFGRTDQQYYSRMRDIFEAARRKAMGADKVLNQLLSDLK